MAAKTSAKWAPERLEFMLALTGTWPEIAAAMTARWDEEYTHSQCRQKATHCGKAPAIVPVVRPEPKPKEPPTLDEKIVEIRAKEDANSLRSENRELHRMLAAKDREVEAALRIAQTPQSYTLKTKPTKSLRATQVIMWSDWHSDEFVSPQSVNQLNEFNQQIADQRIQACITNSAKLMQITAKDVPIDAAILHLGGDFISGNIHAEIAENTWARPIDAMLWVQDRLMAGVRHLAQHTPKLIVACNVGNHSRITAKSHYSALQGNSLEYFAYHNMRHALRDLKNVEWMVAEGYHLFVDLYGRTIRFHHGDAVKYGGGVGGVFIPAYKAISQWNKARHADLDCFCHFHTLKNGGNFILNGSLIGYNGFAVAIKADFERPYQKFFMYTSTGEVCAEYPIFLD